LSGLKTPQQRVIFRRSLAILLQRVLMNGNK
jgi:hypothetical protein